ncbi:MAG: asparagine synthase (glutamine-hydrolyzing) [Flavobacteriales bacterium]|nr:asparagine synthase (glutamine-hydrolyzing) [Flavobacteriales bacterium]
MCGIAGKLFFDRQRSVDIQEIKRMADTIAHRGPDDDGYYVKDNVGLGFRRLSIIDLHTGHQPLSNAHGNIWITFNGEVYNYQEEREKLIQKGYQFKTRTDTEVIVNLYEEYGENCVDHLRGMFAFVIWDQRKNLLFGARDRFGIKPFYYYLDNEQFVWGSEIKVIRAANGVQYDLNAAALDDYVTYGYILSERSIFTTIKKLKPGFTFVLNMNNGSFQERKYWDIGFQPDFSIKESEWEERVLALIQESVKLRMIADVPLGAFLSGGIDSSAVVAMMAMASDRPIKTFSIGFKEAKFNELEHARVLAEKYGTEHHEMIVEPESIGLMDTLVDAYDEPFADSSAIPTYYVSKFAREHVTVALSGDGGDEVFAGYTRYSKMKKLHERPLNNRFVNSAVFGSMHSLLPDSMAGKGLSYYLSLDSGHIGAYMGIFKPYERERMYTATMKERLAGQWSENHMISTIDSIDADFISKMQGNDMKNYLVDDILTKVDRVSMANSLEVRVPLLDHKLFELSAKIPSHFKINDKGLKMILKNTMKPYLPQSTIGHPKQGFGVPLSVWFKDDLRQYVNDLLLSDSALIKEYITPAQTKKIIEGHLKGTRDFSFKIWNLLFLESWLQRNK